MSKSSLGFNSREFFYWLAFKKCLGSSVLRKEKKRKFAGNQFTAPEGHSFSNELLGKTSQNKDFFFCILKTLLNTRHSYMSRKEKKVYKR